MKFSRFAVLAAAAVAACAAPPLGPLVQVLPGPGKAFDQFQYDDAQCRRFADMQIGGAPEAVNRQAVGGAVLGTALGAGLGAIVGGGRGAAVGAVSGAGLGVGFGAASTSGAQLGIQAQFDGAYAQCMYARGNQVPGAVPLPAAYTAAYPVGGGLVREIQFELNRLGYLRAPADGVAGPQTVSAIQSFEVAHGMPADGAPSPYLLDQLRAARIGY